MRAEPNIVSLAAALLLCCHLADSLGRLQQLHHRQQPSLDRYNFFDMDLLEVLNRQEKTGNFVVSPLSVKVTLGMLLEGAVGETAQEIRAALRLPKDADTARAEFNRWLSSLQFKKSSNVLDIGNKLFLSHKYAVQPKYQQALENSYLAEVTKVKFENAKETADVINSWVSKKTSGMIPTLVQESQISANAKLLLTNAVYFKGKWQSPFAPERTTPRCFYTMDDECLHTWMMANSGSYDSGYISALDAQALDLPYGEDGKMSMLVVLPRRKDDILQLSRDMVHVNMETVLSQLKLQEVYVQLPRFTIDYNEDLVEPLEALHLIKAFSPDAELSGMLTTNESIAVSNIFHSARIVVNEEGSEAAAATGALFVPLMGGTTTTFTADRPFLFFIRDTQTGAVVFAGRVVKPEEAPPQDKVASRPEHGYFQDIITPAPPINNAAHKEKPYVMRKPGALPPSSNRPSSSFSVGVNSSLPYSNETSIEPEINQVSTLNSEKVHESTFKPVHTSTHNLAPVFSSVSRPERTEPPSLIRPTSRAPKPTSPSPLPLFTKRVGSPGSWVYGNRPGSRTFQFPTQVYESYVKKMTIFNRFEVETAENKTNSRLNAGLDSKSLFS